MKNNRQKLSVSDYVDGVLACNRAILAHDITLIESLKDKRKVKISNFEATS